MQQFSFVPCHFHLIVTNMLIRSRLILIASCLLLFSSLISCKKTEVQAVDANTVVATKWADLTLDVIKKSIYKSPTYSSRSLGYMGVTMYESVVYGDSNSRSLAGQLNGLGALPMPEMNVEYNWLLSLNAGQQTMLKLLYPKTLNISEDDFVRI